MEITDELANKIIAYINGEMADHEYDQFQELINQSTDLQHIINDQKLVDSIFNEDLPWVDTLLQSDHNKAIDYLDYYKDSSNKEFYKTLKKINPELNSSRRKLSNYRFLYIAASLLMLAIAGTFILRPSSSSQLYTKNISS